MAWWTSATVLARTPLRPLSTRSTVASDKPGLHRDLADPERVPHADHPEGFLTDRQGLTEGSPAVNLDMSSASASAVSPQELTKESDRMTVRPRPASAPG